MQNFVIIIDYGGLFPAEYAYQANTFEGLCQNPDVMQEMSKYSVTEDKWKVYNLSDEKFERYLREAKDRLKKQKAYKRELDHIKEKVNKQGYSILIVDGVSVYALKTAREQNKSL